MKDAQHILYPGCKKYTLLSFLFKLLHLKVLSKWSNKSLTLMLELLTDILPDGHILPTSLYDAKKFLRALGLGYESIHACRYDCMLFWKENEKLDKCTVCGESRYQLNDGKGKKIPHKILRYFPLKPRL